MAQEIIKSWVNGNIFNYKKGDGVAYLVFYIFIPVVVTAVSLIAFPQDDISAIYCYVTILISALNSIYDGANRWLYGVKSTRNTKLFLIYISDFFVSGYCIVVIIYMLVAKNADIRFDWALLAYFLAVVTAGFDVVGCFAKDMALLNCVSGEGV